MPDISILYDAWLLISRGQVYDMLDLSQHLGVTENPKDKRTIAFLMFYQQLHCMLSDFKNI